MPRKSGMSGSVGGRRKRPCPGRDLAGGLPNGTAGSGRGPLEKDPPGHLASGPPVLRLIKRTAACYSIGVAG